MSFSWKGVKLCYAWGFDPQEVLDAGFNTVGCYSSIDQTLMDDCAEKGLWVIPFGVYACFWPCGNTEDLEAAKAFVNKWKYHPAVAAWYFLDEPEMYPGGTPAKQQEWYDALKEEDPDHDFCVAHSPNPNYPYPNYNADAKDKRFVALYPYNSDFIRQWGTWQVGMNAHLKNYYKITGSVGLDSLAIVGAFWNPDEGRDLNPAPVIEEMIEVFQEHHYGTEATGLGFYIWLMSSPGVGLSQNASLLNSVKTAISNLDWPAIPVPIPPNQAPTAPTSLLCEGETNPTGVTDLTPEFSAIYNDPDSADVANAIEIHVASAPGLLDTPDLWDSGWLALTVNEGSRCSDKSYAGTALSLDGNTYYWKARFRDDDNAAGAWSSPAQFTMSPPANQAPSAPTSLLCEGKVNPIDVTDLTPEFSAIYNDPDDNDIANAIEIHVATTQALLDTPDLWDSGWLATTVNEGSRCSDKSYAGSALSYGIKVYWWKARFRDDDNAAGAWSSPAQFTIAAEAANQAPTAPTSLLCEGQTNPTGVTDLTPEFSAIYNDPDDNDIANAIDIHIASAEGLLDTPDLWDSGWLPATVNKGSRCSDKIYAGSALSLDGNTYYWKARFRDDDNAAGAWSSPAQFSMYEAPVSCEVRIIEET